MFFTVLFGISYIGLSYTKAFTREVELPDGTEYFINYYANNTIFYFKLITAL
jgi:hypothetical protein